MAENGEKSYWLRWLVATIWGLVVIVITCIGNNVIANEKGNVTKHEETAKRITAVERSVSAIQPDIVWLKDSMKEQRASQLRIEEMVRSIARR